MKLLNKKLKNILKLILIFYFLIVFKPVLSNTIDIEIIGNEFTDESVILSLIKEDPTEISEDTKYNKTLSNSMLFENVIVEIKDNKYFLTVEYPNISKIYFVNNERLKDDELKEYADQLDLKI